MSNVDSLQSAQNPLLAGLSILVTRPANQTAALIELLQHQGARVLHQPSLKIQAFSDPDQQVLIDHIADFDLLIFISRNAVEYGCQLFNTQKPLDKSRPVAAIGKATQQALLEQGFTDIISPQHGFDSEALLASKGLSIEEISTKQVLIIRGGQGRELLKTTLEQRQASANYLDVYQRLPETPILSVADYESLDFVTVSSQQGLECLLSILEPESRQHILNKILITPSSRCADRAKELGFNQIETAANATDNAMLSCIIDKIKRNNRAKINNND